MPRTRRRPAPPTELGQRLASWARDLPPAAVDTVVVVACALSVIFQSVLEERVSWLVAVVAVLNALPLLWRRRYPFAVTLIVGIGTVWLALADALGNVPLAQLVATYTFAALCPLVKRLIAVAGTIAGATVSIMVPHDSPANLGVNAIAFAMAYVLGTSSRARRDRIAMLEERARRLAEQQDAAAARERERIAREMHDILAHSMGLVVVQAEAGPVVVRTDPDKAEQIFDTISESARDALAQLRRALGILRADAPTRAPQEGIDELPVLIAHAEQAGLTAELEERGTRPDVPADFGATVYRVVQESVTNTVKHAHANRVWVSLDWHDDALDVTVRDDGHGPADNEHGRRNDGDSPDDDRTDGGHGLAGMRERVAATGGTLRAGRDEDSAGFCISARLPLPSQPPERDG